MILKSIKLTLLSSFIGCLSLVSAETQLAMVKIPPGSFLRVDGQTITVDHFTIGSTEVPRGLWDAVWEWSSKQGYDIRPGQGSSANTPVAAVDWFDSVKWCNALSEMQGLTPVYYIDTELKQVFRSGEANLSTRHVNWKANGFRLPTESEWEYACRAGTSTKYFWGDTFEDLSTGGTIGAHYAWGYSLGKIHTPRPVGLLKPNAFGLYDMSGNVSEWCWDWYAPYSKKDPVRGPSSGSFRCVRGGSVALDQKQFYMQSGYRGQSAPQYFLHDVGFRIASGNVSATLTVPQLSQEGIAMASARNAAATNALANTAQAAGERLFSMLNLDTPGLEDVKAFWQQGKAVEALDAYRDYFIVHHGNKSAKISNPVRVTLTLEQAMALRTPLTYYGDRLFDEGTLNGTFLSSMLLTEYVKTKDARFLAQNWRIMDDYILRSRQQYLTLTDAGHGVPYKGKKFDSHWYQNWEMSCGLDGAGNAHKMISIMQFAAGHIGVNHRELLPSTTLANTLWAAVRFKLDNAIIDDRNCVPNQIRETGEILVMLSHEIPEFRDSKDWNALGSERLQKVFTGNDFLADGGDMEQSLNYNALIITKSVEIADLFSKNPQPPVWARDLREFGRARLRMFSALLTPTGILPSVGNNSHDSRYKKWIPDWTFKILPDPLAASIVDTVYFNGENGKGTPDFTSIAFPYSGYYALRNGWKKDDHYLFFKNSRAGRGHHHQDNNSLELVAFGRHLLVDCGAPPYSPRFCVDDQKIESTWLSNYFHEAHSANGVLVDGYGQTQWKVGEVSFPAYKTPMSARWLTSPRFDFTEGTYADGFGGDFEGPSVEEEKNLRSIYGSDPVKYGDFGDQMPAITATRDKPKVMLDAKHHREVIFVKQVGMYIIIDRVSGGSNYTQLWHFPPSSMPEVADDKQPVTTPGFALEHIAADSTSKRVLTQDPNGANLSILHFTETPLEYNLIYGKKFPHRGWFSAGIVGRKVPTPTLYATWSGTAPLVTILYPRAKGDAGSSVASCIAKNTATISGFEMTFANGAKVAFQTSAESTHLSALNIEATAGTLLVTQDPQGNANGLVMESKTVQSRKPEHVDFEFTVTGGNVRELTPITIPKGFHWKTTPAY